jgi:hypothetical protein
MRSTSSLNGPDKKEKPDERILEYSQPGVANPFLGPLIWNALDRNLYVVDYDYEAAGQEKRAANINGSW